MLRWKSYLQLDDGIPINDVSQVELNEFVVELSVVGIYEFSYGTDVVVELEQDQLDNIYETAFCLRIERQTFWTVAYVHKEVGVHLVERIQNALLIVDDTPF